MLSRVSLCGVYMNLCCLCLSALARHSPGDSGNAVACVGMLAPAYQVYLYRSGSVVIQLWTGECLACELRMGCLGIIELLMLAGPDQ